MKRNGLWDARERRFGPEPRRFEEGTRMDAPYLRSVIYAGTPGAGAPRRSPATLRSSSRDGQ